MNASKLTHRRALIAGLTLLGLLAAGCGQVALPWHAEPATAALAASGIIHAEKINVAAEFAGHVAAMPVAEGDLVEAGQVVAQLDTGLLDAQIEAAAATVAVAQAALAQTEVGTRPGQVALAEAQLAQAQAGQAAAAQAVVDLEALVADPQEIDLQIAVAQAQLVAEQHRLAEAVARKDAAERGMNQSGYYEGEAADAAGNVAAIQSIVSRVRSFTGFTIPLIAEPLDRALGLGATSLDLSQQLLDLSYIPYWQGWIGVNAQSESIEGAQAALANLRQQRANPQELVARLNQARAAEAQAEAQVAAAQAQLDGFKAGATPEQLGALQARLDQAQAGLEAMQTQRQMREITAPIGGVVLEVVTRPGEVAAAGATILTIADTTRLALTVYVPETQIGPVTLGQEVAVTVDSFPGRAFPGEVSHIADSAQFTPRNVSTAEERVNLVFAVDIRLANDDAALKPGMPADVTFAPAALQASPADAALERLSGALGRSGSTGPLRASGTVRARELRIASDTGGRIAALHGEAGAAVQAGDVLVELDATPWRLQRDQAAAALATARADLAAASAKATPEAVAATQAALAQAEAQRAGALLAWDDAQAVVDSPQQLDAQIVEARTQVALAAQAVQKADSDLRSVQRVHDANDPNGPAFLVTAAQEAYAAAQADQQTAQVLLDQLEAIRATPLAYIAQAHAAEGRYHLADAAVAVAQARLDDLLAGPTPEKVAVAEAAVRQAEAQLGVLDAQLERATLSSPLSGVVLHQDLRVGEVAAPAATILTLADLSEVVLDVYVPENAIGRVQLGQAVHVSVDSFSGRTFAGRVTHIGDEPEYTPHNVATAEGRLNTFYAVEIRLPNPQGLLKPGMPADAEFGS